MTESGSGSGDDGAGATGGDDVGPAAAPETPGPQDTRARAWTIALRPRPRRSFAVVSFLALALLTFTMSVPRASRSPMRVGLVYVVASVIALLAVRIRRNRPLERAPIVVTADTVFLPATPNASVATPITLADVTSLEEQGRGARRRLVVGTRRGFIMVPASIFVEPDGPAHLRLALRDAMLARADGAMLLAEMSRREAYGRMLGQRTAWATFGLVAVIVAAFLVELATGALDDDAVFLRLGANAPPLIRDGQWWRLFTANLLHVGYLHLYFNVGALLAFGTMLERLLGTSRFAVALLLSGLTGNLASMSGVHHTFSAGASTIAFGLVGVLLLVNVRDRSRLPAAFVLGPRRWAWLIGINGAISLLPVVDGLAHAGGFIGGILATLLLVPRLQRFPKRGAAAVVLAVGLTVAYAGALGAAVVHFTSAPLTPVEELAVAIFDGTERDPEKVNDRAWLVAIDRSSPREILVHAERASRRAVSAAPDNGSYLDTHAYLLHRLGDTDEALALERRAAWYDATPPIFTMLHRLLSTRPGEAVGVVLARGHDELTARAPGRGGAVIYAGIQGDAACGLLRLVLPAGADEGRSVPPPSLPADATFTVLLVDTSSARPEQPVAQTQVAFQPCDAATRILP